MNDKEKYQTIIDKLDSGMKFGLFEKGMKCYFEDGTHIGYNELWKAIRLAKDLSERANKSLQQLYPDSYVGSHRYKHTRHKWKSGSKSIFGFW